ncbi:MAG: carboxypeptidase regulatory-like domain-containing protein [Gemmatimonadales bacterium]
MPRSYRAAYWARIVTMLVVAAATPVTRALAQSLSGTTVIGQSSIVVAYVTDTAGRPLSGAEIQVVGTSLRGTSDDLGRIALVAVPAGKAILRVRRLGYAELIIPIVVTPGVVPDARYRLTPIASDLKKVVVRASELKPDRYEGTGKFDEFYRRRASGNGTFLTREIIDARNPQKSEDLLRMVTGVRIRYRGSVPFVQFLRCDRVNVYVDGIRSQDPFRDLFSMSPLDIEAIEVYHGIATVPPEFSPQPNDCAAIVVWTRWHGGG